jgi:alpha-1,3-glucosyltransferase
LKIGASRPRSTDFEVHRNWLAITSSLPVSKWYTDDTSQWTLDYPPLFAWFEFLLSKAAVYFDPEMLNVSNLEYASRETVLFQRLSVIVSDLVLAVGVRTCWIGVASIKSLQKSSEGFGHGVQLLCLVLLNAGILMVDHIHFQYNGFLFGVFLQSIGCMMQDKFIQSGIYKKNHYLAEMYWVFIKSGPTFE